MLTPVNPPKIYCNIYYPHIRGSQIYWFSELADIDYQRNNWDNVYYEFRGIIEDLNYDDFVLDPISAFEADIGCNVIVSQEEAQICYDFYLIANRIHKELGCDQPNEVYFNSPLWHELARVSKICLDIFLKNEEEAKKTNPCPWQDGDPVGKDWVIEREKRLLQMGYHKITDQDGKQEWVKL